MPFDPYWGSCSLSFHFNGADNSTTFTEGTGKTVNKTYSPVISAIPKFGTGSLNTMNGGIYVPYSSAFDFGAGDFTIEMWLRSDGIPSNPQGIYTSGNGTVHQVNIKAKGLQVTVSGSANGTTYEAWPETTVTLPGYGDFYHFAVVRNGGTVTAYVQGTPTVLTTSLGTTPLVNGSGGDVYRAIGLNSVSGDFNTYYGYIDELRILKGVARYTSSFSPYIDEFTDIAYTISGVVTNATNAPAAKVVRVYYRSTGELAGTTISNATTGAYSVAVPQANEVFVVAHDTSSTPVTGGTENAVILDRVVPA